jgi:hypothetical protein
MRTLTKSLVLFPAVACFILGACNKSASTSDDSRPQIAASSTASAAAVVDSCAWQKFQQPALLDGFHEARPIQISSFNADTIIHRRKAQATGIGWVYVEGPSEAPPDGIEEPILADTLPTAQMVAYLDYWPQCVGGWTVIHAVRSDSAYMYMDRLSEDYSGILATERHGEWVRVLYAWTPDGRPLLGWTQLVPGLVQFTDTVDYVD